MADCGIFHYYSSPPPLPFVSRRNLNFLYDIFSFFLPGAAWSELMDIWKNYRKLILYIENPLDLNLYP